MSQGIADTSIFIARESGRTLDTDALPDELAVSIITIGELRAGVLVADTVDAWDRRPDVDGRACARSDPRGRSCHRAVGATAGADEDR
ncbi:MAG TPA: hypothetical protein VM390_11975 [Acidimicrobiales bacterium]|nr:hypothetical protein [Acidimicrobiales bacterium]